MLRISRLAKSKLVDKLYSDICQKDNEAIRRTALARAITLVETKHPAKQKNAEQLLDLLLNREKPEKRPFRIDHLKKILNARSCKDISNSVWSLTNFSSTDYWSNRSSWCWKIYFYRKFWSISHN